MATTGPLENINIKARTFPVDGEANAVLKLSGYTNEVKPNGEPGSDRIIKSRKSGRLGTIPIVIDDDRGDMEFLQEIMDSNDFVPFYTTTVAGIVWEGNVQITGDPEQGTKEGVMEIEIMGTIKRQGA